MVTLSYSVSVMCGICVGFEKVRKKETKRAEKHQNQRCWWRNHGIIGNVCIVAVRLDCGIQFSADGRPVGVFFVTRQKTSAALERNDHTKGIASALLGASFSPTETFEPGEERSTSNNNPLWFNHLAKYLSSSQWAIRGCWLVFMCLVVGRRCNSGACSNHFVCAIDIRGLGVGGTYRAWGWYGLIDDWCFTATFVQMVG